MNLTSLLLGLLTVLKTSCDPWRDRAEILEAESSDLPGSHLELSENEQKVNTILMDLKLKEYDEAFHDPTKFLPSLHFFKSREAIERSEVFKFIRRMPKGGSLHVHSTAMLSLDALYKLTYMDGLYGCFQNGNFKLHFFFGDRDDSCEWKTLALWRQEDAAFDDFLKSSMTLVVGDPLETYDDINTIWAKFERLFDLVEPLFSYRQFLHDYLYEVMQEFYEDNVMYLEVRTELGKTFDKRGNVYDSKKTLQLYTDAQMEFRRDHPDFLGFHVIYATWRGANNITMEQRISEFLKVQEYDTNVGMLAGFDLVGQEDLGHSLFDLKGELEKIKNKTKFFFHAGETNWYGATDLNLVDAVLLNATRIGHAFAINKHPQILKLVKERDIAIEVNPISNQVLKLVGDLRNHVGATLIANGYPVVVTCDDPGFWGAKGLSYDWYMVFMGMTPRSGDLKILKQLAFNSIAYSSLDGTQKLYAFAILERKWEEFIQEVLETYK